MSVGPVQCDRENLKARVLGALHSGEGTEGFCIRCGSETDGVEPDAEKYECDNCGAMQVYGAEQLLLMLF